MVTRHDVLTLTEICIGFYNCSRIHWSHDTTCSGGVERTLLGAGFAPYLVIMVL